MPDGGQFSFDMGSMGPMLNALMSRYGQMMDLGVEQAQEERPRRAKAFDLSTRARESDLKDASTRRSMAKQESTRSRSRELGAGREARAAKVKADPRYGSSDAGAVLEKNRQYLQNLESPFDAMYTRYSSMRNLPAAGTMSGINFPGWNETAG